MFQSSLPVAGERVTSNSWRRSMASSFNPRSPSPGSVSIHILDIASGLANVSILAPRRRGACLGYSCCLRTRPSVSILAPRRRGACQLLGERPRGRKQFQSSLPVAGERVLWVPGACAGWLQFQSSLPVAGERVLQDVLDCFGRVRVSILAPRRRGACPDSTGLREGIRVVSILAPRRRGACPMRRGRNHAPGERFNPRSPSPGSVSAGRWMLSPCSMAFQSSLPVAGERVPDRAKAVCLVAKVSILAPRRRGACPSVQAPV